MSSLMTSIYTEYAKIRHTQICSRIWLSATIIVLYFSCQRGSVVCDPMVCPSTECTDPIIPEGECCATCAVQTNSTDGCLLGGNNRIHPAGSRWHPYIPPFGFSRCAICRCQVCICKLATSCSLVVSVFWSQLKDYLYLVRG